MHYEKTCIELFAGTKSFSDVAKEYQYETWTTDIDGTYGHDLVKDFLEIEISEVPTKFMYPYILWASVPCTCFSIASVHHHFDYIPIIEKFIPKSNEAKTAIKLLTQTLYWIDILKPKYYFIENPQDIITKLDCMVHFKSYQKHFISYCQYGHTIAKPTVIITNLPNWQSRPKCHYRTEGNICHHQKAKRGSPSGTQGLELDDRSRVPKQLCYEIMNVIEGFNSEHDFHNAFYL